MHQVISLKISGFPYLLSKIEFGYRWSLDLGSVYMKKLPRGQEPKETQGNPHQNSLLKTKWQVRFWAIQEWRILGGQIGRIVEYTHVLKTENQCETTLHSHAYFQTVLTQFYIHIWPGPLTSCIFLFISSDITSTLMPVTFRANPTLKSLSVILSEFLHQLF